MNIETLLNQAGERNLPLLQYILQISGSAINLPTEHDQKIKKLRRVIAARNIHFFEELKKILEAFNAAVIETILLKGVMMQNIYPPGVRVFGDMDILIHKEDLSHVEQLLKSLSYRSLRPYRHTSEYACEVEYIKDGKIPIRIEPHWHLGPPYPYSHRIKEEDLWRRAKKIDITGIEALTLSPEDSLLHFCLHFFKHSQKRGFHILCDIVALLYHYKNDIEWNKFLDKTEEYKLYLPVLSSLEKANELLNSPMIPPLVFERLATCDLTTFEKWVFKTLILNKRTEHRGINFLVEFLTIPIKLKLRYLWLMYFPSKEFLLYRYPHLRSKPLLYIYFYRSWDMLLNGFRSLGRIIKGNR